MAGYGTVLAPPEKPIFYLPACFKLASQALSGREPRSQARSHPCISESPVLYSFTAVSCEAALQAQQLNNGMSSDVC
jgi:hypothetical protein